MPNAAERYQAARVEHVKTAGDYHESLHENPAAFVAGVQYALDQMLTQFRQMTVGNMEIEHILAIGILQRVKRGELE